MKVIVVLIVSKIKYNSCKIRLHEMLHVVYKVRVKFNSNDINNNNNTDSNARIYIGST